MPPIGPRPSDVEGSTVPKHGLSAVWYNEILAEQLLLTRQSHRHRDHPRDILPIAACVCIRVYVSAGTSLLVRGSRDPPAAPEPYNLSIDV